MNWKYWWLYSIVGWSKKVIINEMNTNQPENFWPIAQIKRLWQFRLLMHMCSIILVYCVPYALNWELKSYILQLYTTCAAVFNELRSCKHSTILVFISNETSFESALWVITGPFSFLEEDKMTNRTNWNIMLGIAILNDFPVDVMRFLNVFLV